MVIRFNQVKDYRPPSYLQVITNHQYYKGLYTSYGYSLNSSEDLVNAYLKHKEKYIECDNDLITFLSWILDKEVKPEEQDSVLIEYIKKKDINLILGDCYNFFSQNICNYSLAHIVQGYPTSLFGVYVPFNLSFWCNQYPYVYQLHKDINPLESDTYVYLCNSIPSNWVPFHFTTDKLSSFDIPPVLLIVYEGSLIALLSKGLKLGNYWDVLPQVIYYLSNKTKGKLAISRNRLIWEYTPLSIYAKGYKELGDICVKDNTHEYKDRVQKTLKLLKEEGLLNRKDNHFWLS